MTRPSPRAGFGSGDVLLALAAVALLAAAAYPRVERALMRHAAAGAQAHVEAVRAAAVSYRTEAGAWPAPAEAGVVPSELAGRLPEGFSFEPGAYTLEWGRWEAVAPPPEQPDQPEPTAADALFGDTVPPLPPPPDSSGVAPVPVESVGTVTVHSQDERLLAALLERFGAGRSFVRDRSWTLVLSPGEGG